MKTEISKKPRAKRIKTQIESTEHDNSERPNLVHMDGHILIGSLDVKDWLQTLQDERESWLASLADIDEP